MTPSDSPHRIWALLLVVIGCSQPEPSHIPLGMGPLAKAEQSAKTTQQRKARTLRLAKTDTEEASRPPEPAKPSEPATIASTATVSDAGATDGGAGTSDAGPPPTSVDHWLGLYQGSDVTRYLMEDQPERRYDDPKAKIRVEKLSPNRVSFILIDSSNDQDLCTLVGEITGDEAHLPPGQRCFIEPDEDLTVHSRPSTAQRQADRLTLQLVLDTHLELEDTRTEGRIEYEFDGRKR